MQIRISGLYPVASLADAYDMADQIGLSSTETTIEPSGFVGFLCGAEKDAVHFVLRFNDAKQWPADDPEVFLMIVPGSQEVEDWSAENPHSGELIEMVAIEFASASDQRRFEDALWP